MTVDFEEVDDPAEYNQRRRIRAIHDARERVMQQRRRALDLRARNQVSKRQYHDIIRESVESFVLEIEELLKRYRDDPALTLDAKSRAASWYLERASLGTMTLPPGGREIEFQGLQSILDAPNPIVCEWEEAREAPLGFEGHPLGETETQRQKVQVPEDVLMNAVRTGMEFLSQIGLDLRVDEEHGDTGFGYEDVLEEAPQAAGELPDADAAGDAPQ
jgi:hypothetical protein